jgi:hypothetical protein
VIGRKISARQGKAQILAAEIISLVEAIKGKQVLEECNLVYTSRWDTCSNSKGRIF